jgi:nitrate/TMAO reductase-like tetraheme cytochrome c subunit
MAEGNVRKHRDKLLFLMTAGAIGIVLLVIGGYQLVEFSDSTAFCGKLCHTVMYPEYTVFQDSPHSRVTCAQCHVGSGADYLVRSKLSGIPMILATLTGNYEKPIPVPVQNLRPARDTCEQCHRPERFTGDLVRVHTTYLPDEANTAKADTRVLRVGGGEAEAAKDIHWHIGAQVYYLPLNEKRTEIGWVGVVQADGSMVEYVDAAKASELSPDLIAKEKRLMDCMDCHNRATHVFNSPEKLIDTAFVQGKLDNSLPYLKREAIKALDPVNGSLDAAFAKVDGIREFYRASYPAVYVSQGDAIERAVTVLREVARLTTFPEMQVSWNSYVNNAAHAGESPGCFRCHGKLVATSGPVAGKAVDAGCESCHFFQLPAVR